MEIDQKLSLLFHFKGVYDSSTIYLVNFWPNFYSPSCLSENYRNMEIA